jgi:hypothetical protein
MEKQSVLTLAGVRQECEQKLRFITLIHRMKLCFKVIGTLPSPDLSFPVNVLFTGSCHSFVGAAYDPQISVFTFLLKD